VSGRKSRSSPSLSLIESRRIWIIAGASGAAFLVILGIVLWLLLRPAKPVKPTAAEKPSNKLVVGQGGNCKTIREALNKAQSKDVIVLADPIHEEHLDLLDFKRTDVTIEPEPGKTVTWRAPANSKQLLELKNVEGLRFRGIIFDGGDRAEYAVVLALRCADVRLENVTIQGFTHSAVRLMNCAGETNKPVLLQQVRMLTAKDVEAALLFDVRSAVLNPAFNQNIKVKDCRFEGPFRAAVQFNAAQPGTAPATAVDIEFTGNRFYKVSSAFLYNKQKKIPAPKLTLTIDSNTFCDLKGPALLFAMSPATDSRVIIKNNLFASVPGLAKVETPLDAKTKQPAKLDPRIVQQVFPILSGNVRSSDPATKEDNLSLGSKAVQFAALPTNPDDDATFLRYPRDSALAKAGEDGRPVGAGPVPE
jgi:hypothetical protein